MGGWVGELMSQEGWKQGTTAPRSPIRSKISLTPSPLLALASRKRRPSSFA